MTSAVYHGRKAVNQTNTVSLSEAVCQYSVPILLPINDILFFFISIRGRKVFTKECAGRGARTGEGGGAYWGGEEVVDNLPTKLLHMHKAEAC